MIGDSMYRGSYLQIKIIKQNKLNTKKKKIFHIKIKSNNFQKPCPHGICHNDYVYLVGKISANKQ